jgi:hypothetical protein
MAVLVPPLLLNLSYPPGRTGPPSRAAPAGRPSFQWLTGLAAGEGAGGALSQLRRRLLRRAR